MRGNKLTLECVLESARILKAAKKLAKRSFGRWLTEQAHMDRSTASRHLRVAEFVGRNVASTQQISSLSMAKIYAISTLSSEMAARVLDGRVEFSAPLDQISDVQFRREFRKLFSPKTRRITREQIYLSTASALTRAEHAIQYAAAYLHHMTETQRLKLETQIRGILKLVSGWKGVA
jgi:hypothetical protein